MSFPASVRKQSTQQSKSTLYLQLFIIDCICCPVEIIRPALLSSAWSESNGVLATRLLRWPQDGTSLPPPYRRKSIIITVVFLPHFQGYSACKLCSTIVCVGLLKCRYLILLQDPAGFVIFTPFWLHCHQKWIACGWIQSNLMIFFLRLLTNQIRLHE